MHQVRADDGWTVSLAFASVETESRPRCAQEFRENWDRARLRRGREKNWDRVRSRGGREKTGIARGRDKTGIAKSLPRQDLFFLCCWKLDILFVLIGHLVATSTLPDACASHPLSLVCGRSFPATIKRSSIAPPPSPTALQVHAVTSCLESEGTLTPVRTVPRRRRGVPACPSS